jgi:hypothetical protein
VDKAMSDTCNHHPTSNKSWTAKSACGKKYTEPINDEQKLPSDNGEKNIGNYCAALKKIFQVLCEEEMKMCEKLAAE